MQIIKIPVVIGKNRLRGKSVGAMVDDDFGENNHGILREAIREVAVLSGIESTPEWVSKVEKQLLDIYEKAYLEWKQKNTADIGFVYEMRLKTGTSVVMGDRRILMRVEHQIDQDIVHGHEERASRQRMR